MRKFLFTLLGLILLAGQGFAVGAQSAAKATVSTIDAQGFPTVRALLSLFDSQGLPITGLDPEDVTVLEDGQPFPVIELTESNPPAQIVFALNPGPALAVRDGNGIERFERVTEALAAWSNARITDPFDDLSLVTVAGPLITHAPPKDWLVSLTSFHPDFRATTPNTQVLTLALNTVKEAAPLPGMQRAILLITPHMEDPNIQTALDEIAQQALAANVRIHVWFVDAESNFNKPSATAFKALALSTGGSFFAYSGLETIPDPETYFAPLRHLYTLSYNSTQAVSGEHSLAVEVQTKTGTIASGEKTFSLDVQPPNPILVSPPAQILRQAPADDPFNTEQLLPEQQEIEIIVEFPDGHPRPLARTTLYVDGQPVTQNDTEPFDRFTWNLRDYIESAEHKLLVEVVDSLGMSRVSMEIPVRVTVLHAPTGGQAILAKYRLPIAIVAVVLAGGLLLSILFSGRFRIRSRSDRKTERRYRVDPVTQPVDIQQAERRKQGGKGKQHQRPGWTQIPVRRPDVPAHLTRLGEDGQTLNDSPIPLNEKEITFGANPTQAMVVLDHPSVAALHARLKLTDDRQNLLIDNDTVAGTWVNYEPIPKEGCVLKHGDVVHFGQLSYRYTLKRPPAEVEPKIKVV